MSGAERKQIAAVLKTLRPVATEHALIRLGPRGDGGYLVPDDLGELEACFSPGVGLTSGFETDCAAAGMQVFMADASVTGPADASAAFHFVPKNLGSCTSGETITLEDWVAESLPGSKTDLLLQMDIEGAEFDAILHTTDRLLARFRIIVVEIHELHRFADPAFLDRAATTFEKILRNHVCVHIHPNNCCGSAEVAGVVVPCIAEFTFLRRDRVRKRLQRRFVESLPHPLDADNVPANDFLPLSPDWFV